jgi:hypothetical protein
MPSRADVEQFARGNRDIRALVLADLAAFWGTLNTLNATPLGMRCSRWCRYWWRSTGRPRRPSRRTSTTGCASSPRRRAGSPRVLADPVDVDELRGQIRWSIGPLFNRENPDPAAALGRLQQKVDEFTLQPGRDTIAHSAAKDPAKAHWARVPVGKTCAFCLTLASRGPVYRSAETAGTARKYHGDCDCTPTPYWYGDPHPEGYDPDALYQQYADARDEVGSYRLKPILSELRSQQGLATKTPRAATDRTFP